MMTCLCLIEEMEVVTSFSQILASLSLNNILSDAIQYIPPWHIEYLKLKVLKKNYRSKKVSMIFPQPFFPETGH